MKRHHLPTLTPRALAAPARLALLAFLALAWLPTAVLAQSQTAPVDPASWSQRLEIGPVAGLTTAWHAAPRATGIPLGTNAQLRIRVPFGIAVTWTGAREVTQSHGRSIAEVRCDTLGPRSVTVAYVDPAGDLVEETVRFEVIDLVARPLSISPLHLAVDAIVIDDASPNASTMAYYFEGSSIAALREIGPDAYRTSTSRWVRAEAAVAPPELAPLVEWRLDGAVQQQLGSAILLRTFTAREHEIAAGPPALSRGAELETYMVFIDSPAAGELLPASGEITFRAHTDPPGHEGEITWLASTKYGGCSPIEGSGREFTTTFTNTTGQDGLWLGARADNAVLGKDAKSPLCGQSQQTAQQLLARRPTAEEIAALPAALRAYVLDGVATIERTAAGEICTDERLSLAIQGATSRDLAFTAGFSFVPGGFAPFRSCLSGCRDNYEECLDGVCSTICIPAGEWNCWVNYVFCELDCSVRESGLSF